jgi:hypothetical protein
MSDFSATLAKAEQDVKQRYAHLYPETIPTMKTRIIGIDPGAAGSIAVFWESGRVAALPFGTDDVHDLLLDVSMNSGGVPILAVIEQVGTTFPPGGKVSPKAMFSFGHNFGFLCGWLRGAGIPYRTVRPQEWQKGLSIGKVSGMDRKRALKAIAARQWPNLKVTLKTCDALLIADWARRNAA